MLFPILLFTACGPDGDDVGKPSDSAADTGCDAPGYVDADGDGYGDLPATCGAPGVAEDGDCDDADPEVFPGAPERCNERDDDCDGDIEGPVGTWYTDADGDGHGDPATGTDTCTPTTAQVESSDDCDDANEWVYPGAVELCDGVDNDCDAVVDGDGIVSWRHDGGTWEDKTEDTLVNPESGHGYLTIGQDGDLWMCPGTYPLHIWVNSSKVVGIHGRGGSAATVLDAVGGQYAVNVDDDGTFTIDGFTLTGTDATGWGGAALNIGYDVTAVASDLVLTGNTSAGTAGAIYVKPGARFDGTDIVVRDNRSTSGGVFTASEAESVRLARCTFTGNAGSAGALSFSSGTLTIEDCVFEDNAGTYEGGAIGAGWADSVDITRSTFTRNTAPSGGALNVTGTVNTITDCTFTDNDAPVEGGAVYTARDVIIERSTFVGNSSGDGGSLFITSASATLMDVTVTDGVASNRGGAIYTDRSGLSLVGTSVTSNQAREGGALYLVSSEVTGTDVAIDDNAAETAGAVAVDGQSLSLVGGSVSGNSATGDAGALRLADYHHAIYLDGVVVEGNVALGSGGAISMAGGDVVATGVTFTLNDATTGGAACVEGGHLTLDGTAVTTNSAVNGGGIALLVGGDVALANGTTLTNNVADEAGGGLYLSGYGSVGSSYQTSTCDASSAATNSPEDASFDLGRLGRFEATSCPLGTIATTAGDFDATASPDFSCDAAGCR